MNSKIGDSVEVDKVLNQFDFPMMSDFMIHYGDGIDIITSLFLFSVCVYMIIHTFLMSGLINHIIRGYDRFHRSDFLVGGSKYFFKMFRLEIFFLCLYALIFGLANFGFIKGGLDPFKLESDIALINRFLTLNSIALVIAFFVRIWQENAKYFIVDSEKNWIYSSLILAINFLRKNFFSLVATQLCFSFLLIGTVLLSYFVLSFCSLETTENQWCYILIAQLFVIIMIFIKILKLLVWGRIYQNH